MKVRAVLFDLDDTLIDRRASMRRYVTLFLAGFGGQLGQVEEEAVFRAIHQADGGGYRGEEKYRDLQALLPWREMPTVEEMNEHWQTWFGRCATAMAGMREMLEALQGRGYRLGLITNGGAARQNEKVDTLGIRPYLDAVIVSEAVGVAKPDPRVFAVALREMGGVRAEEACYVGDYPVNDVIGAANAGLLPIWRRGVHEWPAGHEEPRWQFEELAEVVALLERIERGE